MKAILSLTLIAFVFSISAQKRTLEYSDFSEISLGVPGTLYVKQGNTDEIIVDCDDDVFDEIEFELRGDRLVIKNERNWNWRNSFRKSDLDIYVTMRDIERLSLSGSG